MSEALIVDLEERILLDRSLSFLAQRQGGVVVVQCMDCGEHTTVSTTRAARGWREEHEASCAGDDDE